MYSTIHEYSRRDLIWRLEYIYFPSCTVQYMCIQEGTWFEGWGTYISQAVKYSTCVFRKGPLFGGWGTYIFQAVQNSTCVFRKGHGSEDGVHIYPKLYSTVHVYSGRDLVRRMGYIYISQAVQYSTCVFRKGPGLEDGVHIYPKLCSTVHVYSGRDLVWRMGYIYIPSCTTAPHVRSWIISSCVESVPGEGLSDKYNL